MLERTQSVEAVLAKALNRCILGDGTFFTGGERESFRMEKNTELQKTGAGIGRRHLFFSRPGSQLPSLSICNMLIGIPLRKSDRFCIRSSLLGRLLALLKWAFLGLDRYALDQVYI